MRIGCKLKNDLERISCFYALHSLFSCYCSALENCNFIVLHFNYCFHPLWVSLFCFGREELLDLYKGLSLHLMITLFAFVPCYSQSIGILQLAFLMPISLCY